MSDDDLGVGAGGRVRAGGGGLIFAGQGQGNRIEKKTDIRLPPGQ